MSNLVHLDQGPLSQLLECTDLTRLLLLCEEDFTVSTLTDLRDDVELSQLELGTSLSQQSSLSTKVGLGISSAGSVVGIGSHLEVGQALLSIGNVAQVVKVVVEEV